MAGCCCDWDDIYITEKYVAPHCGTCECKRGEFEIRRSIPRPRCSLPRRKISCYYLPDINYCRKNESCLCYECRKVRGRSEASIHRRVGGKCSQHEKSVLETWFTQFDSDRDGYLNAMDLDDLFHHLGAEMRNSYSKKILNTCDRDCDGLLSFPEFVRLWQRAALHDNDFFRTTGCHILSPIVKKYKLFSEFPCCTCTNHRCKHVTFASEHPVHHVKCSCGQRDKVIPFIKPEEEVRVKKKKPEKKDFENPDRLPTMSMNRDNIV